MRDREGEGAGVGEREGDGAEVEAGGEGEGAAVEADFGGAGRGAVDLHVGEAEPLGPAGAEQFEHGFFGGEPDREMLRGARLGLAVVPLGLREHPGQEALATVRDGHGDAVDFDGIEAEVRRKGGGERRIHRAVMLSAKLS